MVKEIVFLTLIENKKRTIVRLFNNIFEAYDFAHKECRANEYIAHII